MIDTIVNMIAFNYFIREQRYQVIINDYEITGMIFHVLLNQTILNKTLISVQTTFGKLMQTWNPLSFAMNDAFFQT